MFGVAIAVKAFDAVLELVAGYVLIFRPGWIGPAAAAWSSSMLIEHPALPLAAAVTRWGEGLTLDTEHFASTYLIAHGAAKLLVAWGLFKEKPWSFPTGLAVFGLLVLFQLHRYVQTHSITVATLIAFDLIVIGLIAREWRYRTAGAQAS
jgi:uncharacterized membrane protein